MHEYAFLCGIAKLDWFSSRSFLLYNLWVNFDYGVRYFSGSSGSGNISPIYAIAYYYDVILSGLSIGFWLQVGSIFEPFRERQP